MTQNETVRCGMPQRDQAREVTEVCGFLSQMVTKKRLSNRRHLDCARTTGYTEVIRSTLEG